MHPYLSQDLMHQRVAQFHTEAAERSRMRLVRRSRNRVGRGIYKPERAAAPRLAGAA